MSEERDLSGRTEQEQLPDADSSDAIDAEGHGYRVGVADSGEQAAGQTPAEGEAVEGNEGLEPDKRFTGWSDRNLKREVVPGEW